jgi:LysR family transcriptional regulator, low CO2-responsive transcriptional regulator
LNHAQLKAFHAVAEEGGFSAAARRLGVTQPAVTVQVKALEAHYQVELFYRRSRKAILTALGLELHELTRRMFALERQADALLQVEGGLERGRLDIAADGPFRIMPLIRAIRGQLPGLRVTVRTGNSAFVRRALLDYEAELGVLSEDATDERFTVLSSNRHAVVLMIPTGHPWARRSRVEIVELQGEPMILRERGSATRRRFEDALAQAGVAPEIVLEIGSRESVREAVAAGLGLGVIQEPELRDDPRIATATIGGAEITAGEFIICLAERRPSRVLERLARLL